MSAAGLVCLVVDIGELHTSNMRPNHAGTRCSETFPNAIELIVGGYVSLNDRKALDDLRMQRQWLAVDPKHAPVLII